MVSTLRGNRANARGIAGVNDQVSDEELVSLNDAGVVGVRFNQLQAGATPFAMLESLAPRFKTLAWHVELHLTERQFIDSAELLLGRGAPLVLDHYAWLLHAPSLANGVTENLMWLMDSGRVWVQIVRAIIIKWR